VIPEVWTGDIRTARQPGSKLIDPGLPWNVALSQSAEEMVCFPPRATAALLLLSAITSPVTCYTPASTAGTDALAALAIGKLGVYYAQQYKAGNHTSCTLENVAVRREW
jgi:hypothetical protein